jgi:hypothetical protein
MDAPAEAGVSAKKCRHKSAANFHLVGDHGAVFVAHGFNFGDGKATVAQIRQGTLQSLVQFVLEGGSLLRRGEKAGIDAILLTMTIVGEKDELNSLRGELQLRRTARFRARKTRKMSWRESA